MENEKKFEEAAIAASQALEERDYWLHQLSGELEKVHFPYDHKLVNEKSGQSDSVKFTIGGELFERIMHLRNGADPRLHMILASTVIVLLHKYTASQDIIVGTTITRQPFEGEFVNTLLALRSRLEDNLTFKELLMQFRQTINEAYKYQNYPVETLLYELNLTFSADDFPLFDTAILLENIHDRKYLRHIQPGIIFSFLRTDEQVEGVLEYQRFFYERSTIEKISKQFNRVLEQALFKPGIQLTNIDILSEKERKQLLIDFNNTASKYPPGKTLHEMFQEQAECTPEHAALGFAEHQLTYRVLNERANRLARVLRNRGAREDTPIVIMVDISIEMVIGTIGVLKCGSAFLPVDPAFPKERLEYIVRDCQAPMVLTQAAFRDKIDCEARVINLEDRNLFARGDSNPEKINQPGNLVYIIYTSGSTGNPKGVMIQHGNIVNQVFGLEKRYPFDCSLHHILLAPFTFDPSVQQIFLPLTSGGTLFLVTKSFKSDPKKLLNMMTSHSIDVVNTVPSLMDALVNCLDGFEDLHFKYIILAGEVFPGDLYKKIEKRVGAEKTINIYGPAEATINTTLYECDTVTLDSTVPIGRPLMNYRIYILDKYLKLVPPGVPGELCVSGEGLARGYLNSPELTNNKFINHPYEAGKRLYRTGDLGKWKRDGNIEFLGRRDHQVKIRGVRVELEEIENQLGRHEGVKEAAVIAREDKNKNKFLSACIVSNRELNASEIQTYLLDRLPGYMVPTHYVQLEQMPLTSSGKIDRQQLQQLAVTGKMDAKYIPPGDDVEKELAKIWEKELQLKQIGIRDNYFNIGGDSIKSIALLSLINRKFNTNLEVADLFTYNTIETLAGKIKEYKKVDKGDDYKAVIEEIAELKKTVMSKISLGENIEDIYPMSDIEKGMLYYYLRSPGTAVYHIQIITKIHHKAFDIDIFVKALELMVEKHQILRSGFNLDDYEEPVHLVYNKISYDFEHIDLTYMSKYKLESYINKYMKEDRKNTFNTAGDRPLWRMRTFGVDHESILILWSFHHAILDGWSNASFLTELNNTYLQLKTNPNFIPGRLQCTYKEFVIEQMVEKREAGNMEFWRKELENFKRLQFARFLGKSEDSFGVKIYRCDLGMQRLEKLQKTARKHNTSVKNLCFAAYAYVLYMLSYENDILVGLLTNNRPVCKDGDKVLGCFLNSIPVRLKIPPNLQWKDYMEMIENKLLELKKYEKTSLFEIKNLLGEPTEYKNPLFDALFNFIDFFVLDQLKQDSIREAGDKDNEFSFEGHGETNTLIDFTISTTLGSFTMHIDYRQSIFRDEIIKRLQGYYEGVLDKMIFEPEDMVCKDKLISAGEKQELLYDFNTRDSLFPRDKTLNELFEEQVARTPHHVAVKGVEHRSPGRKFFTSASYKELDRQSNHLGHLLRAKGIKPGICAGIIVECSLEMILAISGILKAGGAYIPINPGHPPNRKKFILDDSGAKILLTTRSCSKKEKINFDKEIIYLEENPKSSTFACNLPPFPVTSPAYIIYTSGSTGKPKGVPITHANISPLLHWGYGLGLGPGDRVVQNLSYFFDWSVWEIFITLTTGAGLYIADRESMPNPADTVKFMEEERATVLHITPTHLQYLLKVEGIPEALKTLKYLFIGAEKLTYNLIEHSYKVVGQHCRVFNMYGPTEATIISSVLELHRSDAEQYKELSSVPIGKPAANQGLLVLDKYVNMCPVSVPGELYIAGDGLALGYLNDLGKTLEAFIKNKFQPGGINGERLYKTGDLVRWSPNGDLEFLGRIDHQVKIRGHRIELGEIENQLLKHPGIKEAVVLAKSTDTGDKYLCAYAVTDKELPLPGWRKHLSTNLPDYMIPSYFVPIEKIPLTPNGKLDGRALPEPEMTAHECEYVTPRDKIEKKLAVIWTEVLASPSPGISIDADFFELGGHSLKAILLISKIHKAFNVNVPLTELFVNPTIRALAAYIKEAAQDKYFSIKLAEIKDYYALSSQQARLYVLQQMDEREIGYNIPLVLVLEGNVDKDRFENTIRQLVERHEILRTSFVLAEEVPVQKVRNNVDFEIEYFDMKEVEVEVKVEEERSSVNRKNPGRAKGLAPLSIEPAARNPQLAATMIKNFIRPFDLSKAPLLRVGLINVRESNYIFIVDMHHIVSDGASMKVLMKEFMALYNGKDLPAPRIQYKDFSEQQNRKKQGESIKQQEAYWRKQFKDEIPLLNLPTDYSRPMVQSIEGSTLRFEIDRENTRALKNLALKEGTTLFMVFLSIYTILLSRLSNQEDIVVGTPTAGRNHADLEHMIGMFVNTLALRNFPGGENTFKQFLAEVKNRTLEAFANQDYSYEDLVEVLAVKRDASRNPLFDIMFTLQNLDMPGLQIPGLKLKTYEYETKISKFDISLNVIEGEKLFLSFEYSTKIFKKETIERFILYFKNIVSAVPENPGITIAKIEIIPEAEKKQVLIDFNKTGAPYIADKTIVELVEARVKKTPHNTALIYADQHLTYRVLNQKANRIGHQLRKKGIDANCLAALVMERSIEMVEGILGILKAGGAYLPIDPGYPRERVRYMLEDSESRLMLTRSAFAESPGFSAEAVDVESAASQGEDSNLEVIHQPENLVYMIYTSGSTGKPKGVIIKMLGFVNLLHWYTREFRMGTKDNNLLITPISFDQVQKNLFSAHITGGCLTLGSPGAPDYFEVSEIIEKKQITIINCAPSMFYPLMEFNSDSGFVRLKSLRQVFLGGEPIKVDKLLAWVDSGCFHCEIVNTYGPTECTDTVSFYRIPRETLKQQKRIPIGKPIPNVKLFILDGNQQLLPVAVTGELCIGGIMLSPGYYNNVRLTGEKFLDTPHLPGKRIYRTGDLARWLPDGNIEFCGRIDHQLKVRGSRIELGEIEGELETFEKIKEAIVLAKEDENGEIYICAYIVPVKELSFSAVEMRKYLSQRLPDYMIPSYFVELAEIPLTPSGKLDRKSLPGPKVTKEAGEYIAPRDQVEKKLVEIWSAILGMKASIGIDDNFFQLGGHSLKAAILMSRIHKELNVKVPLAEIFKTPTIRRLAEFIKGAVEHKFLPIKKAEEKEYYILSSAQKRLYILQQMDLDSTAYNMPAIMTLKGDFQRKKFEEIPGKLIERHESLRTSFIMISIEDKPVQRIHEEVEFPIHHWEPGAPGKLVDDRDTEIKAIVENFTRPFDLSKAPLLRIGLIKITREKYLFLFDMHHIITDGISQDILTGEFLALHSGKNLPPPGLQYKDFAEWQNSKEQRKHIKQQEEYWTDLFPEQPPVLNLPTDYKRPAMQSFEGDSVNSVLNEEETGNLKKLAAKQGVTLFMTILSIYTILLSKLSGQEDIIVGTPTAGRRHADFGQIIGMFVNTLALRNYPSANKTFKEFLQEVKESTIAAHENQEYPFEDLVEKITVNRDTSRNPVFDVMFNLLDREERFKGTADDNEENEENIHKKIKEASKFDMNLRVIDRGEKLTFNFEYCTKLFKRDTIERIIGYFKKILSSVLLNPDKKISGIEIIPGARRKKRLLLFNEDLIRECGRGTIQNKLSESFQENKNSTAIEYGKNKMLYRELDRRSSCISNWIIHNKIKKGSFIGIYTDDKFEIISALIGILRARCVFVPLDTMLPGKRINHMLRITNTQIVFTDITNKEKLANICNDTAKKPDTIVINDLFYEKNEGLSLIKEDLHYRFDDRVYVYFTSGTTGEPKGIIGKNESLVQFIQWEIDLLGVNSTFRVSQFTAVGFDAFLRDVFTPLCAGGTICIPGNRDIVMDSNCLIKWIDENRINLIHCVPSLFRLFNTTYITVENFRNLKYVLLSGEHINPPGLKNWFDLFAERIQLVNLYGPTEVTMTKTYYFIKKSDTRRDRIPIGEPITGCEIILLDKNLHICDRGMIGEIYIRTPYRTFGYYNDPGLNRERFIPNPFSNDKSDLIYKTGDLGRELADGSIELIGRIDRQVKIRGVRIELDEIENLLLRHQKIKEAIVLAKIHPNGEKYLCAYIAGANGVSFSVPELREYLSKELPDYMIPSFVVTLEKMPLTPSGKIDRKALPEPGPGTQAEVYYAPRNTIEEQLVQVWSEILGLDKINISIDANFFELGGHSLKATTMAAKIHEKINVKVPLAKIFRMSTIRELAKYIITAFKQRYTAIEPAAKKEYYPLSLTQKRFYIIQQLEPENTSYNLPMVLQIEGRCPLDKLEQTFRSLIKRHQGLRTFFVLKEGEPMQRVTDEVDFAIQYDEAPGEEIDKLTRDLSRPFDLARAPLMQVALIKVDLAKYILMVEMHHIITDGISIGLLTDEFITLFAGKELPPLKLQYTDFSEWQNRKSQEEMIKQQSEYWFQQFKNGIPGHNLHIDYQRPSVQDSAGDSIYLEISAGETRKLKQLALAEETSLYMVLFSLYYVLLWKLTGQKDIVVGTAVSGRRHMDLMDIIGLFFNTLPIRHRLSGEKTFKEFLTDFNDNTLLAFENQDYPLDKLVEGLVANQILTLQKNRNPLFDTMFSLQNFETRARNIPNVEIPDLKITPYEYDTKTSRCDLFFITYQLDSTISIRLQYATALFKKSTVEKIKKHYLEIIQQILENQEIQLKDITISSEFLQVDTTVNREEFYNFGF